MSLFRDTLEADIYRGRRMPGFTARVFWLLLFGHGQRGCLAWLRFAQFCRRRGLRRLARWSAAIIARRFACYINLQAEIGAGLRLPHPVGIVVGEGVIIGKRCTLYQNVTLGGRRLGDWQDGKYPRLGDGVVVFSGAAVVGALSVGDGATIGANAVVLEDVPADGVAVGIPARLAEKSPAVLARRA